MMIRCEKDKKTNEEIPALVEERGLVQSMKRQKNWIGYVIRRNRLLKIVMEEHAKHEETVLFPQFRSWFPGVTGFADDEHDRDHAHINELSGVIERVQRLATSGDEAGALEAAKGLEVTMNRIAENLISHMGGEEAHLNGIGRKYFPTKLQKECIQKVWHSTPVSTWAIILPFLIKNNYLHKRRVRAIKCLEWAMPERIQLVGKLIYEGVSPVLWERLVVDIPSMIPRHVPGWNRIW